MNWTGSHPGQVLPRLSRGSPPLASDGAGARCDRTPASSAVACRVEDAIERLDEEVVAPHHALVYAKTLALVVDAVPKEPSQAGSSTAEDRASRASQEAQGRLDGISVARTVVGGEPGKLHRPLAAMAAAEVFSTAGSGSVPPSRYGGTPSEPVRSRKKSAQRSAVSRNRWSRGVPVCGAEAIQRPGQTARPAGIRPPALVGVWRRNSPVSRSKRASCAVLPSPRTRYRRLVKQCSIATRSRFWSPVARAA